METNLPTSDSQPSSMDEAYWNSLMGQEKVADTDELSGRGEEFPESGVSQVQWADGAAPSLNQSWQKAQEIQLQDEVMSLHVTGFNKGGLLVTWEGLQGFVPASQLLDLPDFHLKTKRQQALEDRVSTEISVKIIEINPANNRLIFSERAAEVDAGSKEQLWYGIAKGDKLTGRITNLADFGAFVDLGGVEGLIHLSQISWARIEHPSDVVAPGDDVEVVVLDIDKHKERVALSLKQVSQDPWLTAESTYAVDQHVTGIVKSVKGYGAFVELTPGLEGLIHVSELAEGTFFHPQNIVQVGQQVTARVLRVDAQKKRLSLSLRKPSA